MLLTKLLLIFAIIDYKNPTTMKTSQCNFITPYNTQGKVLYNIVFMNYTQIDTKFLTDYLVTNIKQMIQQSQQQIL